MDKLKSTHRLWCVYASFVNQLVLKHKGEFETTRSHVIREYQTYGMTVMEKLYADDEKDRYFHLYHKSGREHAERTQLETELRKMAEMMDKNKGRDITFGKRYEHYFNLTYHEKNGKKCFYGYTRIRIIGARHYKVSKQY